MKTDAGINQFCKLKQATGFNQNNVEASFTFLNVKLKRNTVFSQSNKAF
jgi:hypothetical protein